MSAATEAARSLCRYGRNPLEVARQLGIRTILGELDTPDGALFKVGDVWVLAYSQVTTKARLIHMLGHYALHRHICTEFLGEPIKPAHEEEADEFTQEWIA